MRTGFSGLAYGHMGLGPGRVVAAAGRCRVYVRRSEVYGCAQLPQHWVRLPSVPSAATGQCLGTRRPSSIIMRGFARREAPWCCRSASKRSEQNKPGSRLPRHDPQACTHQPGCTGPLDNKTISDDTRNAPICSSGWPGDAAARPGAATGLRAACASSTTLALSAPAPAARSDGCLMPPQRYHTTMLCFHRARLPQVLQGGGVGNTSRTRWILKECDG